MKTSRFGLTQAVTHPLSERRLLTSLLATLAAAILVGCRNQEITSAPPAPAATNSPPETRPPDTVGSDDPAETIKIVRLYYATDRKRTGSANSVDFYGGERSSQDDPLEYGVCHVTLPPNHQFGKLETYSLLRFEIKNDPQEHVTLTQVKPKPEADFFTDLRATLAQSDKKEIFLFIHGYNVSWEESARRAGQIAYDIGLDKKRGAPMLFSWPSRGSLGEYVSDEANVRVTKFHLATLLTNLAAQASSARINVLAHSMGNQALSEALHMIGLIMPTNQRPLLDQVVMAAPDLDVDQLFNMSKEMKRTANRLTIYSCKTDLPIRISRWFHGNNSRVGSFALINGFDTVDATLVQVNDLFQHSYIGSLPVVLSDLKKLLATGCSVPNRCCCCFESKKENNQEYWAFQATTTTNCTHNLPCP